VRLFYAKSDQKPLNQNKIHENVDYRSDPIIAAIQSEKIGHLITEFFNRICPKLTLGSFTPRATFGQKRRLLAESQ